jgi:hypothetical protein
MLHERPSPKELDVPASQESIGHALLIWTQRLRLTLVHRTNRDKKNSQIPTDN